MADIIPQRRRETMEDRLNRMENAPDPAEILLF
jgi:hypothetical protein